jgi:hypothetical protein
MRKLFLFAAVAALAACNNDKVASMKSPESDTSKMAADVNYAYTATYSSKFEIGNTANTKKLLEIWKDWDNGNLMNHKDYYADTVEMRFADGSVARKNRDSILAMASQYRNSFSAVRSEVDALMPTRSIDKKEDWACVWGREYRTNKNGTIDSSHLQESWRFDSTGKVNLMLQYARSAVPPKK